MLDVAATDVGSTGRSAFTTLKNSSPVPPSPIADEGEHRGHPLTTRGVYGFGELPDRITLYKNNLQEHSADLDALRSRVRITLVHEIGHYFGLDDARLHELGWA